MSRVEILGQLIQYSREIESQEQIRSCTSEVPGKWREPDDTVGYVSYMGQWCTKMTCTAESRGVNRKHRLE